MDATQSEGYLEIDFEKDLVTPKSMELVVLLGVRGSESKDGKGGLGNGEHVSFKFDYQLSGWDTVARIVVPPEAQKILR